MKEWVPPRQMGIIAMSKGPFWSDFFEDGTQATSHHVSRIAVAKVELKCVRGQDRRRKPLTL